MPSGRLRHHRQQDKNEDNAEKASRDPAVSVLDLGQPLARQVEGFRIWMLRFRKQHRKMVRQPALRYRGSWSLGPRLIAPVVNRGPSAWDSGERVPSGQWRYTGPR